jgi:hypothetical protein
MKKAMLIIFIFSFGVITGFAQKKDALFIYGEGFSFWVIEPEGWLCHTEDAFRYTMNAYFCLGKKKINKSPAIMHITVLGKGGDTIQQSLAIDMEDYRKKRKKLEFLESPINALAYEFAAKTYFYEDKTIDYVCYVDPDKNCPLFLAFVLHGPKEVSPKYEKDFISLVKSFFWMAGDAKGIKK